MKRYMTTYKIEFESEWDEKKLLFTKHYVAQLSIPHNIFSVVENDENEIDFDRLDNQVKLYCNRLAGNEYKGYSIKKVLNWERMGTTLDVDFDEEDCSLFELMDMLTYKDFKKVIGSMDD